MSIKKNAKYLFIMLALFTFFIFGCEKSDVKVNNVSINLDGQTQVVLLVDEFFDFEDKVSVSPNYATDKSFSLYSLDEDVVRVVGKQIKAIKEGETLVRVVSNSNQNVEDVVSVKVFNSQTQLETPTNLHYDEQSQSFSFNPVDYAYSYSININDREFNIGNATTFNLSSYVGEKYNNVLSVKVKANAPTYTLAYKESAYSEYIKIFQTSSVDDVSVTGGVLTFSGGTDIVFDVYFNNEIYVENTSLNRFDLTNLNSSYAGTNISVYVVAKPSETIKNLMSADVQSFYSHSNEIVVNVIDEPTISVCDSIVSWEAVAFVDNYQVLVNDRVEAVVSKNNFNLKELSYFENINEDELLNVCVKSVFKENGTNLAKSTKLATSVSLIRLKTPNTTLTGNTISWQAVDNATIYSVEVLRNEATILSFNTNKTSFEMTNFDAGNYIVKITAVGSNSSLNYLTSKSANVQIIKDEEVNATISNYVLTLPTETNFNYQINFVIDDRNTYNQTILANSNKIEIDLSGYTFSAGNHAINIVKLGNNAGYIDSVKKVVEFTQLEAVNVGITNSVASITRSNTNKNAEIYLEISGDSLENPIKVKADSYKINTTDTTKTYLTAGDYNVVAYVEGNGSSTFSYGVNKTASACGQFDFKVLSVPSLSVLNSAVAKISVNQVENATNYTILDENDLIVDTVVEGHTFSLASGESKQFKVRANGNNSTTLPSLSSNAITVKRLVTPTLSFNSNNLSFNVTSNNTTTLYEKTNFYFDELLNETYSFNTAFTGLVAGENRFKVNLKSKGNVGGVEYIDSLFNEIIVKKLSNQVSASVDSNNKLNISNNENAQIMLSFDFDTTEYLAQAGKVAGLNYIEDSNKFIITLLDNNFNAIKTEMTDGFSVKVKFVKQTVENSSIKTYYTNSDWSNFVSLNLNLLSEASAIYSNTDNKLIIENPNSEKLYLDLMFCTEAGSLEFKDNGRNQLVYAENQVGSLTVTYTYSNNKYYVDLYKNETIYVHGVSAGESFTVSAKLKKSISGSDVDSKYSRSASVYCLQSANFVRDDQNLSFTTINNDYELDKYKLIINDSNSYNLNTFASVFTKIEGTGLTKYSTSILDLLDAINNNVRLVYTDINSLKLETLNTLTSVNNVLLGSTGNNIYLQQASTFEVTSSKVDGKTIVNIGKISTDYLKTYHVELLDGQDYADSGEDISVVVDDLTFSGNLSVYGYVKATSSYTNNGKLVYVFNSVQSNSLTFVRLAKPELTVSNNKINFTAVAGATEYEVYKMTNGSSFEKVDESILTRTGNSFMFNNLNETAEFTVAVKAVTSSSVVLNSNLSESVTVVKLGKSNYYIDNGYIKLSLPSGVVNLIQNGIYAELVLGLGGRVYNFALTGDMAIAVNGISWVENADKLNISAGLVFDYQDDYILDKDVSVLLKLDGKYNNKYYIYTDSNTNQVKGLFAPTDVQVNKLDSNIEKLTYSNNSKNKLSLNGDLINVEEYVFSFTHNNIPYYSTDAKLKYFDGTSYVSYGAINSTNIAFPYGYDANNDGDFDDEGDVVFDYGDFRICVACFVDGYVLSPYSQECVFSILNQTEVSITNGEINWGQVAGADKYIVRVREKSTNTLLLQKEIVGFSYDFEDFDTTGLLNITVQAITSSLDKLNSKETEGLQVYRLPKTTSIKIENGVVIVTASQFIESIKIEYAGKTLICKNKNQRENLQNVSSISGFLNADLMHYYIDLTKSYNWQENTPNKLKVKLCGNSGTIDAPIIGTIGMINSQTVTDEYDSVVLGTIINNVSKGVWTYCQNSSLGSTDKVKLNYNFNNDSSMDAFWLDTILYQIKVETLSQESNKTDTIFAVDYNRFISAVQSGSLTTSTSQSTYYELCDSLNGLYAKITCKTRSGDLYFNVYKNNTIDLQNYDNLYYYAVNFDYLSYSSIADLQSINLAEGGTFAVSIRTVGGNEYADENVGYITSYSAELQPFVRFGQAYLTTDSGKLAFASLKVEDEISPVYKITVYEWNGTNEWYVYLYDDSECSEDDVRQYFNLDSSAIVEPIELINGYVVYEMGKHFGGGIYSVDTRALAGVGADDYLLNAKQPESRYVVKVFTSTTATIKNGNVVFNLAYVNIDGVNKYNYNYEIAVEYNGVTYLDTISSEDENVIVEGTKLTYTLADKIGELNVVAGNNYKLKVRALTDEIGFINAKFATTASGSDSYVQFTRENPVSDVKIENGVLNWYGGSSSSDYLVKVRFYNLTYQNIVITSGYVKNGENYSYTFADSEYSIYGSTLKTKIIAGLPYTVSVSRVGNSTSVISSSYVDVTNVFRLNSVNVADIKTQAGLLTWTNVSSAVGYKIELIGTSSYTYTINENINSIDLTTNVDDNGKTLQTGSYTVKVLALGGTKINSVVETASNSILKLNVVTNVQILGDRITWDSVENANGYRVKFIYNNKETQTDVTTNYVSNPTDIVGKLKAEIIALAVDDTTLLNSNVVTVETSSAVPNAITGLKYNNELNRFEWSTQADFLNTDTIKITYSFLEYSATGNKASVNKEFTISYEQVGYYENGTYFYPISVMGKYNNFTLRVQRVNSVDSASVTTSKDLCLFEYGAGTSENPYVLDSMQSLTNIKYYANANYKLIKDINVTASSNGAIIDCAFAGTILGENFTIKMGTVSLNNATEFALFKSIDGGTITKLSVQANIENSITKIENDVKLAILAVSANNATLENVRINSSSITVTDDNDSAQDITGKLYVGGIFAIDNSSTLTTCSAIFSATITADYSGYAYIGGAVASGTETNITSESVAKLTIVSAKNELRYLGGVIGYYVGNVDQSKGVTNSSAELNFENISIYYVGGVFGYARYALVEGNTISGTMKRENITGSIYAGGVAGTLISGTASGNTVNSTMTFTIQTLSGTQRLGKIVGSLEVYNGVSCSLSGNYSSLNDKTALTTNSTLTLGCYGYKDTSAVFTKVSN